MKNILVLGLGKVGSLVGTLLSSKFNVKGLDQNKSYKIPIAHGEGRYYASEETINKLVKNNQILFKYANEFNETQKTLSKIHVVILNVEKSN